MPSEPRQTKPNNILKKYIVVFILFCSCSDPIGPCYEMELQCKSLQAKMEQATDHKVKEQYRQKYLAEKHLLENCYDNL